MVLYVPRSRSGPLETVPWCEARLIYEHRRVGRREMSNFFGAGPVMAAASLKKIWNEIGPRCAVGGQCVHASCHANTN